MIEKSIAEHARNLRKREYSSEELTCAYLKQIEACDGDIHAYLTVTAESAVLAAKQADVRYRNGEERGLLDGIPFAVKDNLCTEGVRTTCASRMLAEYIPPYRATVMKRLQDRGGILLGKTNLDEFAMGSTTEYSAFFATKNPLNRSRVPGGSSGGSAAAVAANETVYALGSDTGGSVRQPASFCGLVGMKPTYGRVSRYGLIAFAPSLEQIGPMTRTVEDNAIVLSAIAGRDAKDATSGRLPEENFLSQLTDGVRGLRVGMLRNVPEDGMTEEVQKAVWEAAETYRSMGAEPVWLSLPLLQQAIAAYYVISSAEASSDLGRFDGIRYGFRPREYETAEELCRRSRSEGFGEEVKRRILLGSFVLSEEYYRAYYQKAMSARNILTKEMTELWRSCDCLLLPTYPTVAPRLGQIQSNPTKPYREDWCGVLANLTGMPSLTVPCGIGEEQMPIGLQILGPHGSESLLYRVGFALEQTRLSS